MSRVARSTTKKICIGGDFNVDFQKECDMKNTLELWSIEYDFIQTIQTPTWKRIVRTQEATQLRSSLLDLLFTNAEGKTAILDPLNSDHSCISYAFENQVFAVRRKKIKRREYRFYKKEKLNDAFMEQMRDQSLSGDPDFDNETIINSTTAALDIICPFRTIRTALPTDIVDTSLEKIKKKRKRLLKEYHKTNSTKTLSHINHLNKKIKEKIRECRQHQINLNSMEKIPKVFGIRWLN